MKSNSVKLTIKLTEDQMGDFPVSTESLWFDIEDKNFRVKNIPFFIDDLSFDDVVSLKSVSHDLYEIDNIVDRSGNSTVWICITDSKKYSAIIDEVIALGCAIEGGVLEGYFAINVPKRVDIGELYRLIDSDKHKENLVADFPSIRHIEVDTRNKH